MKITPKTEEQIKRESLLEPGWYDFEVVKAEERISKSGNEMLVIEMRLFSERGNRFVTDYLLDSMAFKLRHFFVAIGMKEDYEAGNCEPEKIVGRAAVAKIGVQVDKSGDYSDRNTVRDYASERPADAAFQVSYAKKKTKPEEAVSDDIPF